MQPTRRIQQHEPSAARRNLRGDDGSIGTNVGLHETHAVREATLHAAPFDIEVGAHLALGDEIDLREEQSAAR
jgi:hypothetical protein